MNLVTSALNGLDDDGDPLIDFSDLDHEYDYGRITSSVGPTQQVMFIQCWTMV